MPYGEAIRHPAGGHLPASEVDRGGHDHGCDHERFKIPDERELTRHAPGGGMGQQNAHEHRPTGTVDLRDQAPPALSSAIKARRRGRYTTEASATRRADTADGRRAWATAEARSAAPSTRAPRK